MSFDEEFSLVAEDGNELQDFPMEGVQMEIHKCKVTHERLVTDQRDLSKARDEQLHLAEEYNKRCVRLRKVMEEEEQDRAMAEEGGKARLVASQEEERRLREQLLGLEAQLCLLDQETVLLQQRAQESNAVPEKRVVFLGAMSEGRDSSRFNMKSRILYPMEGGTALITFEEEDVARNIMKMKQHDIKIGDCCLSLEARPVHILMPSLVEMTSQVCCKSVLVSDVPKEAGGNHPLDRMEIHFSKRRNQGGEVDQAQMLQETGNVVLTFVEDTVAKRLTDRQYHEVDMGDGKKHQVKVTPYLNGEITNLQTRVSVSARTVLLTGIPAIMDPGDLQDQLEIHFQKNSNGGGEVEAIAYNALTQRALAVFEDYCPAEKE
ncbi:interferon-induced 35 kDa protein-like [Conger conger]|uniref:interferon-induced 35 kDa protein-like n=1 Tax=Conger conger TaxID=82655 RepID=UPI002A5A133E|nr:interferon-induced 35 kDa protein-like [Conger conger]